MTNKHLISFALILSSFINVQAQTTIKIQPDAEQGKDALIHQLPSEANRNFGDYPWYTANAWSFGGEDGIYQCVMDFDLSVIPPGAEITSAYLSLYGLDENEGYPHSTISGSNACWLQRITENWEENTVTWNSRPSTTTENQVAVDSSTYATQNYLNIDVSALVQDMKDNPETSFGFLIKLQVEERYRRMTFASSDNDNIKKHPKLVITYNLTDSCITLQPNADEGKDALLHQLPSESDRNYGDYHWYMANAWSFGGDDGIYQCVMDFDLSAIPVGAEITNAYLSLYGLDENENNLHSTISGSNACWLQRITENWEENTVTWNTRPSTTAENQVAIDSSTYATKNYLNINVSALVQDMKDNPETSFGFLIKLQLEEKYRRMSFVSSDHTNVQKHPKLVICYSIPNTISENIAHTFDFNLFPNPASNSVVVNLNQINKKSATIQIINSTGQLVETRNNVQNNTNIDLTHYAKGLYFINVHSDGFVSSKKLMVE
jgi:thioredoxin reductase